MNILFSFPFEKSIVGLLLWFDSILLHIFSVFYKAYLLIAQTKIFQSGAFDNVIHNIYLIVGIVALFVLSWILLQNMINPDGDKGTNQIKEIMMRSILMIMLTCLVPTIFSFLSDFQNSILAFNVLPNAILGNTTTTIEGYDADGNYIGSETVSNNTGAVITMSSMVDKMVVSLINGIMYPIDETGARTDDLEIDVSEFWGSTSTKVWGGVIGCAGAGAIAAILVFTGVGAAPGIAGATAICGAGALTGVSTTNLIAEIDAKHYTWQTALSTMQMTGSYDEITLFAGAIVDGNMHYTALISTVCIGILVYMVISFCIDLAVRACKLSFYEVIAPICLLISIIPQKKDLLKNWVKMVLTTWLEIFIRIGCICGVVLLVGKIDFNHLISISHPLVSAFILLGLITFAKQVPKLFSQLTGIDSGNLKLDLKEKLREGTIPIVNKTLGMGTKKLAAGLDAKAHGRRFKEGADKVEGYFAQVKKKMGGYLPYSAKAWESKKAYKETQDTLGIARSNYAKYGTADDFIEKRGDLETKEALKKKKTTKNEWAEAKANLDAILTKPGASKEEIQAAQKVLADATTSKDLADQEFKDLLGTKARLNEVYKSLKYYEDSGRMRLDNSENNVPIEQFVKKFTEENATEPILNALDNLGISDETKKSIKDAIIEALKIHSEKSVNGIKYNSQDAIVASINDTLLKQVSGELPGYEKFVEAQLRKTMTDDTQIKATIDRHMEEFKTDISKTIETVVRDVAAPLKTFESIEFNKPEYGKGYKAHKNDSNSDGERE